MPSVLLCQGTALALPLKDASVHCCVTSPPYYGLRDYGVQSQLGLEASVGEYVGAMVQVFREVHRVLRPDGTLWMNMGDSYNAAGRAGHGTRIGYKQGTNRASATGQDACRPQSTTLGEKQLLGMPWRVALALQADGWVLRSEIIWHKVNTMPESVQDRCVKAHEQIFMFAKQARYFFDMESIRESVHPDPRDAFWHTARNGTSMVDHAYDAERGRTDTKTQADGWVRMSNPNGRACRSVWPLATEPFSGSHFATFPQALVRRCLLAGAPTQVCAACGAPWKREVSVSYTPSTRGSIGKIIERNGLQVTPMAGMPRLDKRSETQGFFPTCACAAVSVPATVLDPFCGSGTTLLVARELGHHAVGLDLSWNYLSTIARERLGLRALEAWEHGQAPQPVRYDDLPLFGG